MKRNRQVKFGTFKCECGCGETFTANYVTRTPKYVDKKHRNKVLAKRKAEKREAKMKELFRQMRERRAVVRKMGIKNPKAISIAVTGTEREFKSFISYLENRIKNDD